MTELHSVSLTRRSLLGTGAALVAANALPSGALAQGAKFRRWEITDPAMPPRVLDSYKKGIGKMLGLPPTDPRNWYRNAFVHVFDCPHQNWWFLAWHRAYLGWLEVTLRDLSEDKDFALPYWDWTKTPRVPAAMFEGVLDPNNAAFIPAFDKFKAQFEAPVTALYASFSPAQNNNLSQRGVGSPADFWDSAAGMFFDQPDARGLTAANPDLDPATKIAVSMATITNALRTPTFAGSAAGPDPAGFDSAKATSHNGSSREGVLEGQPHDNVHGAMGGPGGAAFMVSFLSPVDPIFFLHHGNLDRLWDVWTRRQIVLKQPALPEGADLTTWSAEQFLFFSDEKGNPVSKTSPADYTTLATFNYDYSPGSGENQVPGSGPLVAAASPPRQAQVFSAQIASASIGSGTAAGGVTEVPAAALQGAAAGAPPRVAEITLDLTPADRGRRFRVLVSPGGGANPVEAGAITVFGHHLHGPTTFAVPIPEIPSAAAASGNVPLDIRVVPIEPTARPSPAATAKAGARAPQPGAAPKVSAIRVTI
jgi:tyrosinase